MKNITVVVSNCGSKLKVLCISALVFNLMACGGTGQDSGSVTEFSQTFSGVGIDGYLARSTVFIDANNNGTRDAWEAWAFTDNEGYYSFNKRTGVDYCASNATPQQRQYCLVSNIEHANVVVRIDAGYDVITGEPFSGQLSRRVNANESGATENNVLSPITTLFTSVEEQSDRQSLLESLAIEESHLDVDYLNDNGNVNAPLLNTSLKIHKVVSVLSDRLTDTYTEIGEDFGTPNDASSAVYPNLATQIINAQRSSGANLDAALSNPSTLLATLDTAESSLREVYERKEFPLPADMGDTTNAGSFERVVSVASRLSAVVNNLIDLAAASVTLDDAIGGNRALEALVIKTINEPTTNDTSIDNAISFFETRNNPGNESRVDTLLANLSFETADVSTLASSNFNFEDDLDIMEASNLPEGASAFTQIGGRQLRVSDLDLGQGFGSTDADDSEVEFYFDGSAGDIDGSFKACVKHVDGANVVADDLGEGGTEGELVEGFWSLLGSQRDNPQSYSLLITITYLETTYQAIMKPAGPETIGDQQYQRIRFDFDGDLNVWHSAAGFVETETVPTTNQACQDRLPSRIGL